MQRAGDATAEERHGAIERGYRLGVEYGTQVGSAEHFEEMAEQAEPGNIGAACRAMCQQARGSWSRGLHHRRDRALDDRRGREPARVRRKDYPRTEGLRQNQPVVLAQSALAQKPSWTWSPGHGETQRELGTLGTVPADEHRPGCFEHVEPTAQHVQKVVLDKRWPCRRQGGDSKRALRGAAHR